MFKIMGSYLGAQPEELDSAENKDEAEYLKEEYEMERGDGWVIWVEEE